MKAYHMSQAKYWANTAYTFRASGLHIMAALFSRYSDEHTAKALEYANED